MKKKLREIYFTCDRCGKCMRWVLPRKEGNFCEACWAQIERNRISKKYGTRKAGD